MNVDFADVTAIMVDSGRAHMGVGSGTGKDKAMAAANEAITSPLLESKIDGANGVLINFTVSPNVTLNEVIDAAELITSKVSAEANTIWGYTIDENLDDEITVTVIATGFDSLKNDKAEEEKPEETVDADDAFDDIMKIVNGIR